MVRPLAVCVQDLVAVNHIIHHVALAYFLAPELLGRRQVLSVVVSLHEIHFIINTNKLDSPK